jgi:hypothetical protein
MMVSQHDEVIVHFDQARSAHDGWLFRRLHLLLKKEDEVLFEVCPSGNSVDTHCIWEALLLGLVPVVKKTPWSVALNDGLYSNPCYMNHISIKTESMFPMLQVESWSDAITSMGYYKKNITLHQLPEKSKLRDQTLLRLTSEWWATYITCIRTSHMAKERK